MNRLFFVMVAALTAVSCLCCSSRSKTMHAWMQDVGGSDGLAGDGAGLVDALSSLDQEVSDLVPDILPDAADASPDLDADDVGDADVSQGGPDSDSKDVCVPACDGKQCGDDGCQGQCGTCPGHGDCVQGLCVCPNQTCGIDCCAEGQVCNSTQCCTPDCTGKVCGDDGCGGSCGVCSDTQQCTSDVCIEGLCVFELEPSCCLIESVYMVSGAFDPTGQCRVCQPQTNQEQWSPVPNGTSCGASSVCYEGNCCDYEAGCLLNECGENGCGGSCGLCAPGTNCQNGQCVACVPDCAGKACGDDGCGGFCGATDSCAPCVNGMLWTPLCAGDMCFVPAGKFLMGCEPKPYHTCEEDEMPLHEVDLGDYWVDMLEVSVSQYKACAVAGKCTKIEVQYQSVSTYGCTGAAYDCNNYPITHITLAQADAYCKWVGKRLCTEAEWEKAARGVSGCVYPWGDAWPTCEQANYVECEVEDSGSYLQVSSVQSHIPGASPYGARNMVGNVGEWVSDWYMPDYYQYTPVANPTGPSTGIGRVVRGGSHFSDYYEIRASLRWYGPEWGVSSGGIRCCSDQNNP